MVNCGKIMADRLHMWRRAHGLTQVELAKKAGMRQENISKWERGKAEKVSLEHLVALADTMDVSLDYLLGRIDET